jgi:hypothetical protein
MLENKEKTEEEMAQARKLQVRIFACYFFVDKDMKKRHSYLKLDYYVIIYNRDTIMTSG